MGNVQGEYTQGIMEHVVSMYTGCPKSKCPTIFFSVSKELESWYFK